MRHRDVFYNYAPFIAEVPKSVPSELSTQIGGELSTLVEERDSLF